MWQRETKFLEIIIKKYKILRMSVLLCVISLRHDNHAVQLVVSRRSYHRSSVHCIRSYDHSGK